jgi:hypothetical protein
MVSTHSFLCGQLIHVQSHEIVVHQLPIVPIGNAAHAKHYIKTSDCPPLASNQIFPSYQCKSSSTTQALAMATINLLLIAVVAIVYTVVTPTMATQVTTARWLPAGSRWIFSDFRHQ